MDNVNEKKSGYSTDILYGIINSIMVLPVSISFCSIIFRNKFFETHIPVLVKLVLFSSSIHQFTFSINSSLPFAVGQVQDAGLIFLSAMASAIVEAHMQSGDKTEEVTIASTLVILSISTLLLGVMLIILGRLQLASYLQYLPMPVIGGYLAFIGFFCGEAGLAMMSNVEVTSLLDWNNFANLDSLIHLSPGLILGILYYILGNLNKSPWTLPVSMLISLCLFYGHLFFFDISFEDARNQGWIMPLTEEVPLNKVWSSYNFSLVDWQQLFPQFWRWVGMVLVVAFSSSLDVAAIEMELGLPLDYDKELTTVGLSNLFSGATGGFTGSYIFSQTIFNLRRGVNGRLCGFIIGSFEALVIVLPFSITSYTPKFLYGSLLILIAVDLMADWLIFAFKKMPLIEVCICWMTFAAIQFAGIEIGLVVGIIFAFAGFCISYTAALLKRFSIVLQAGRDDNADDRIDIHSLLRLSPLHDVVLEIPLQGFIFFGSAVGILSQIKSRLVSESFLETDRLSEVVNRPPRYVGSPLPSAGIGGGGSFSDHRDNSCTSCCSMCGTSYRTCYGRVCQFCCRVLCGRDYFSGEYEKLKPHMGTASGGGGGDIMGNGNGIEMILSNSYSGSPAIQRLALSSYPFNSMRMDIDIDGGELEDNDMVEEEEVYTHMSSISKPKKVLVLNFHAVLGVDSTAARSCFVMLVQAMRIAHVQVVFVNISSDIEALLRVQKVISSGEIVIRGSSSITSAFIDHQNIGEF